MIPWLLVCCLFQAPASKADVEILEYSRAATQSLYPGIQAMWEPVAEPTGKALQLRQWHRNQLPGSSKLYASILPELLFETAWYAQLGSPTVFPALKKALGPLGNQQSEIGVLNQQLQKGLSPAQILQAKGYGKLWQTASSMQHLCQGEHWELCLQAAQKLERLASQQQVATAKLDFLDCRICLSSAWAQALFYQGWSLWKATGKTQMTFALWAQSRALALQTGDQRLWLQMLGRLGVILDQGLLHQQALEAAAEIQDPWLKLELLWLQTQLPSMNAALPELFQNLLKQAQALHQPFFIMEANFGLIFLTQAPPIPFYLGEEFHELEDPLRKMANYYCEISFNSRLHLIYLKISDILSEKAVFLQQGANFRTIESKLSWDQSFLFLQKAADQAHWLNNPQAQGELELRIGSALEADKPGTGQQWLKKAEESFLQLEPELREQKLMQIPSWRREHDPEFRHLYALEQFEKQAQALESAKQTKAALKIYWQIYLDSKKDNSLKNRIQTRLFQLDPNHFAKYVASKIESNKDLSGYGQYYQIRNFLEQMQKMPNLNFLPVARQLMETKSWEFGLNGLELYRSLNQADWPKRGIEWVSKMSKERAEFANGWPGELDRMVQIYLQSPDALSQSNELCLQALGSPKAELRHFCLELLFAQSQGPLAPEHVWPLLKEPDLRLRNQALDWLIAHHVPDLLEPVLTMHLAGNPFDLKFILTILDTEAQTKDIPQIEKLLQRVMEGPEPDYPYTYQQILGTLLSILIYLDEDRGWQRMVNILEQRLNSVDPAFTRSGNWQLSPQEEIEPMAATFLLRFPNDQIQGIERELLKHPNPDIRLKALTALQNMQDSQLVSQLMNVARDIRRPEAQIFALHVLKSMLSPENYWDVLVSRLDDDASVKKFAFNQIWPLALKDFPEKGLAFLKKIALQGTLQISITFPSQPDQILSMLHPEAGLLVLKLSKKGLIPDDVMEICFSNPHFIWKTDALTQMSPSEWELLFQKREPEGWLSKYQDPDLPQWLKKHMNQASEPLKAIWSQILEKEIENKNRQGHHSLPHKN